jgi:hypothetical protein
LGLDLGLDG